MMEQTKLPTSFWVISVIGLLWNLMGVGAWYDQITMDATRIAAMPEAEQVLFNTLPTWVNVVFGISVITGALGCIALLMKKKFATPLFIISMIAAIAQMVHSFLLSNALEVYGGAAAIFPAIILVIGFYLIWYAKSGEKKGWLN